MDSIDLDTQDPSATELAARVQGGAVILLTRDGEPVARITAVKPRAERPRKPLDVDALRALTAKMKPSEVSSVEILREMRDSRY